jgi:hypothetical protein
VDDKRQLMNQQMMQQTLEALPASSRGETVSRIVRACGLQDSLAGSVCLTCGNAVLAQNSKAQATLYCRALFRDLETCITDCTAHSPT